MKQNSGFKEFLRGRVLEVLGIVLATVSVASAIVALFLNTSSTPKMPDYIQPHIEKLNELSAQFNEIREQQQKLENDIKFLSQVPVESKMAAQLSQIETLVKEIQTREAKLEQAILNDPAKAIEVPLMRRDLDSLKDKNQADLLAVRQEVDRVYDQNKWFLSLMGTMALGILTLALSNFFKKDKAQ
jgi:seryl-tRNA synthetase